jgi:hypothetical protein
VEFMLREALLRRGWRPRPPAPGPGEAEPVDGRGP